MKFKHSCNFITSAGTVGLVRCESCDTENYSLAVMSGVCYACGYDANKAVREAALDELVTLDQELGLYDLPDKEAS